MPNQVHSSTTPKSSLLSIANIDSINADAGKPFREYLLAHGCQVFEHTPVTSATVYHIVIGPWDYVKAFIEVSLPRGTKRLIIVWDEVTQTITEIHTSSHSKLVLSDARPLLDTELQKVFSFFFTSSSVILDIRAEKSHFPQNTHPIKAPKHDTIDVVKTTMHTADSTSIMDDTNRIQKAIADVYGKTNFVKKNTPKNFSQHKTFLIKLFFTCGFIGLIILPIVWYALSVCLSGLFLIDGGEQLRHGRVSEANTRVAHGLFWQKQAFASFDIVRIAPELLGLSALTAPQDHLLSVLQTLTEGEQSAVSAIREGKQLSNLLLAPVAGEKNADTAPIVTVERLRNDLFYVENLLGLTQGELNRLIDGNQFPFSLSFVKKNLIAKRDQLNNFRQIGHVLENLLTMYPKITGIKSKKTYLLLFQNSMELRPTGGFIGSVALTNFSDGRMGDLSIQDVYQLDGQLRGHVDPPEPLRTIMNQEHWYLRDSNWDPDFRVSGKKAAWFYEKITGQVIDGVIAINMPFVEKLLTVTGPIDLPEYNDHITSDNFFGKSYYYVQSGFFPGSTQKKDFLGALAMSMFRKFGGNGNIDPILFLHAITDGVKQRDIQFYFTDADVQSVADHLGWTGAVPAQAPCLNIVDAAHCLPDYIYIVEANVGVDKANYFIQREGLQQIAIGADGSIHTSLSLQYKNTSTENRHGGGIYKTYTRIYLPQDSIVANIMVDGNRIPTRNTADKKTPVFPYAESYPGPNGLMEIAIAYAVPAGQETQVTISYERGEHIQTNTAMTYALLQQYQPGMRNAAMRTIITTPNDFTLNPVLFHSMGEQTGLFPTVEVAKQGQLGYNTSVPQDSVIMVQVEKPQVK